MIFSGETVSCASGVAVHLDSNTSLAIIPENSTGSSLFTDNHSSGSGSGGAIYANENSSVYLENTGFTDNVANDYGGAIYMNGSNDRGVGDLTIINGVFSGNTAGDTALAIVPASGIGQATQTGIKVVDFIAEPQLYNNVADFHLAGDQQYINMGAYDYSLVQDNQDWYLRSQVVTPDPQPEPVPGGDDFSPVRGKRMRTTIRARISTAGCNTASNQSKVTQDGDSNVQTRLGLRSEWDIHPTPALHLKLFIQANYRHNSAETSLNVDGVDFTDNTAKDSAELSTGISGNLGENTTVWGKVGQQEGSDDFSQTEAAVGVSIRW
jgi:predicted outer membrane repeat protein